MKLNKYFFIGIIGLILLPVSMAIAQPMGQSLWYPDTGLHPVDSNWHIGTSALPIPKGWFTDLSVAGAFTLSGTVGVGGINMNGENIALNGGYVSGDGDDEGIYVDSSGKVGIGTASPDMLLHISKSINSSTYGEYPGIVIDNPNASGYSAIWFNRGAGAGNIKGGMALEGTTNDLYYRSYGSAIKFQNSGATNLMVINTSTQKVGIGTTSPSHLLSVGSFGNGFDTYNSGGTAGDALKVVGNNLGANFGTQNTNVAGYSGVEYIDNAGSAAVFTGYKNGGTGEFRFNNVASSGYINFMIGSASKMVVANSGNVGIGTTSPSSLLHIRGAEPYFTYEDTSHSGTYDWGQILVGTGGSGESTHLWRISSDGTTWKTRLNIADDYIALYNAAGTEKVRMNTDGNVGIGTTSPTDLLMVSKNQNTPTNITVSNTTSGNSASANFIAKNDASKIFEFGIYSSGTAAYGPIAAGEGYTYTDSPGLTYMANNVAGVIKFATGGNGEKVRITSTGNVGIGTTSPDAKLDVLSTTTQLRLTYTDNSVYAGFSVDSNGNLEISPTGKKTTIDNILKIQPQATAPATCSIGEIYVDTSGGYCACSITNTWENLSANGSCE